MRRAKMIRVSDVTKLHLEKIALELRVADPSRSFIAHGQVVDELIDRYYLLRELG